MQEKKLVIFDLDGTLNRTELYAVPAHKKALADLNIYDKTDDFIISLFGARGIDAAALLINNDDEQKCLEYLKKVSEYEIDFITKFSAEYEGTTQMLQKLNKDGYYTAICSNSSKRYITMVLKQLNIFDMIDYIQPLLPNMTKNDTLGLLLENEKPSKAVMVGDRVYDKNAANANNIPFIGCMYGFNNEEICDADIAVKTASEINEAVKKLIG